MYEYSAEIAEIVDGDPFIAVVDVGFYIYCHQNFRLLSYEAPEIRGVEKAFGAIAKAKLQEILPVGLIVRIQTEKADSFGRWLAKVIWEQGTLSEHLIRLGYGVVREKGKDRVPFDLSQPYPLSQNLKVS